MHGQNHIKFIQVCLNFMHYRTQEFLNRDTMQFARFDVFTALKQGIMV